MTLRLVARILPTVFIVGLTIAGLLFPDQIKWFQEDAPAPVKTIHAPKTAARKLSPYPIIILILGVITLIASALKDAKEQQNEPGHLSEEKFLEVYTDALTSTLEFLPLSSIFIPSDSKEVITNILKNVVSIAEAYKSDSIDHIQGLNACWYQAKDAAELTEAQLHDVARFMDPARSSYDKFLVLTEWAYVGGELIDLNNNDGPKHDQPCVDVGFTLPVDSVSQYTLPGAPEAYNSQEITIVPDISSQEDLNQHPGMNYAPVNSELRNFFQDRTTYISFVNLPVAVGNQVFGVICIQSKKKHFCSLQSTHDQNMFKSLKPFLAALALLESYSGS